MTIHYDHCIACGSKAISKCITSTDYTVSNKEFEIWECKNCTFRFTQDVPSAEEIGPYYQSAEYVSHSDTKEGLVNKLYHLVRNHTLKTKRDLVRKATGKKQGALLDVGAGTGAFAHIMQQAGWDVTGLEPDDTARKNATQNYSLNLQDPSNLYGFASSTFDAITMWHVLEHVHDLGGYLEKFEQILKPGGRLFVAVPNHTSYDAAHYGNKWAAYDVPRHLYHFSPESMKVLIEQKGFKLDALKPMWFDSVYMSMLSEKYKTGKANLPAALVFGLLSNMKAMFNPKKCSSVIYIIRKKNKAYI